MGVAAALHYNDSFNFPFILTEANGEQMYNAALLHHLISTLYFDEIEFNNTRLAPIYILESDLKNPI